MQTKIAGLKVAEITYESDTVALPILSLQNYFVTLVTCKPP